MRTFVLLLLLLVGTAHAYTAKKREPSRPPPAFWKTPPSEAPVTNPRAFAPAAAAALAAQAAADRGVDDDDLIGYGTALVACAMSLALGFGLGYGT